MASILRAVGLRSAAKPEDTTASIIESAPSADPETAVSSKNIALTPLVEEPVQESPQRVSMLGKRRRSDGLYNYTIQVVCCTGESFDIHQGLLMDRSEEYARHTQLNDTETASGVFEINHDFNTVHAMKEFLYKKELPISDDFGTGKEEDAETESEEVSDNGSDETDDEVNEELFGQRAESLRPTKKRRTDSNDEDDNMTFESDINRLHDTVFSLTKLIVLAEAMKMQELCEAAADALIHKLGCRIKIPVDSLMYAHDNAPDTSVVRQILLVYSAKYMKCDDQESIVTADLPCELLSDLLFTLVDFVEHGGRAEEWREYATGKALGRPRS